MENGDIFENKNINYFWLREQTFIKLSGAQVSFLSYLLSTLRASLKYYNLLGAGMN